MLSAFWTYATNTAAPPSAGQIRTDAGLTTLWVNEQDTDGFNRAAGLATVVDGSTMLVRAAERHGHGPRRDRPTGRRRHLPDDPGHRHHRRGHERRTGRSCRSCCPSRPARRRRSSLTLYADWPPVAPVADTLYLRLAP